MAFIKVILKEKIGKLGTEADTVKVKAGFARNFLIPQNKAYEATKGNLKFIENLKKLRAKREAEEYEAAFILVEKIKKLKLKFVLASREKGKAFGSVTNIMIANELEKYGIKIDRHKIQLKEAIKKTGKFDIPIKLHEKIEGVLKITVEAIESKEAKKDTENSENKKQKK